MSPSPPGAPAARARRGRAGGPGTADSPSVRSTPKSRRISASASRAVASTAARSAASAAWSGPSRRRTAWVWMVTTLIEWDTMSCSSRAIRVRSSAAARAASASRSRSSCAARATASSALRDPVLQQHAHRPRADEEHHRRRQVAGLEVLIDRHDEERHHHEAEPEVAARRARSPRPTVKQTSTSESRVLNSPAGLTSDVGGDHDRGHHQRRPATPGQRRHRQPGDDDVLDRRGRPSG